MAKQEHEQQEGQNEGVQEQVSFVTPLTSPPLSVSKKDMNVEIETQLTRKLTDIGIWVVTSVLAILLGGIITTLWSLNGKVNEISGKYSSPENIIKFVGIRVDSLEKENKRLTTKIYEQKIDELNKEIKRLTLKKEKNGN